MRLASVTCLLGVARFLYRFIIALRKDYHGVLLAPQLNVLMYFKPDKPALAKSIAGRFAICGQVVVKLFQNRRQEPPQPPFYHGRGFGKSSGRFRVLRQPWRRETCPAPQVVVGQVLSPSLVYPPFANAVILVLAATVVGMPKVQ